MNMFKVGDRVKCINDEAYYITTSLATLTVVGLGRYDIKVRLDGHESPDHSSLVGEEYWVSIRYFKLDKSKFKGNN